MIRWKDCHIQLLAELLNHGLAYSIPTNGPREDDNAQAEWMVSRAVPSQAVSAAILVSPRMDGSGDADVAWYILAVTLVALSGLLPGPTLGVMSIDPLKLLV